MNQDQEQAGQEIPVPDRLPERITEGMTVNDREGEAVGVIQVVYFGGANQEAIERVVHPQESPQAETSEDNRSAFAFDADNVPEVLRARMMRQGFIIVEGPNLTGATRYIRPEQIEGIFDGAVRLRASHGELLNAYSGEQKD
jgi:hypothetical protein